MRSDNPEFASYNQAQSREPNFVVEISFDSANTDLLYLTKEAVTNLTGSNVVDGVLESISGTTQKLDPRKALSTIGSMSFSAVDDTLTATQKTKLQGGDGLRGKRVRFYVGAVGLDWSEFVLAQTQIIDTVTYKDNAYTFKCSDIQRQMRKDIFELKKTALADHLAKDDSTITVYDTTGFERVQHPASPSSLTDAPGQKVGYLKITQGDDVEIIRYTNTTATTFTGCTRGVLGTKPIAITLPTDTEAPYGITSDETNGPKVEEYVYLALPGPMMIYAFLTGSIYGEVGEYLPDHWHMGISTDYVKTSDFTNIGNDWWDTSNADNGVVLGIKGVKKTDAKKFVEEQLLRVMGAFSPVYSTGEIGLKRMSVVHSSGGYVRVLNETNIVDYGELTHDMKAVINRIAISWNWEESRQAYTRTNILIDSESISQHGEAEPLKLELRGLTGSLRHSKTTLQQRFDSLRDRYAGPPLRLDLTLTPDQNDLEVGDIVRVDLDAILDYTGEETDHTINRNFEVQQVSTDWVSGKVQVKLFGSSQKAGEYVPDDVGTVLDTAFYSSEGTEINATNFPGNVSSSGGITTVSGNITLTGHDDLTNTGAIYYCNEDLTINGGVVVSTTKNVQIRVNGFMQINGAIDAKGAGAAGAPGVSCVRSSPSDIVPNYATERPTWIPEQKFIGASASQPGFSIDVTTVFYNPGGYNGLGGVRDSIGVNGSVAPLLEKMQVNGDEITDIPTDITGQPGSGGGPLWSRIYNPAPGNDDRPDGSRTHLVDGGQGGAGGGGIMIFCEGAGIGASGYIDTSGGDGAAGGSHVVGSRTFYAGRGAGGAPGAIYIVVTDEFGNHPSIDSDKIRCYYGSSDATGYSTLIDFEADESLYISDLPTGGMSAIKGSNEPMPLHTYNNYLACYQPLRKAGFVDSVEDIPEKADDVVSFTLTEYTNTPPSQQGNISTIEVSVTAPSDPNYSYAFIQYKVALNSPWLDAGPASPEGTWQVPSDGTTYYVRALSVSKDGVMSSTGPQDSITVADVVNDPDTEAPTVMTFDNITVTCESGGATFTGKDAKFSWTDTNKDKLHFLEYKVEIKDGSANLMRTERTKDAFYVYTYEKNKEDYEAFHASAGANRSITITVTVVGAIDVTGGKYEGPTDSLSVSNPAPSAVGSLNIVPGYGVVSINGTNPTDLDFTQFAIHVSDTASFTASASTLVGYAKSFPITISEDADGVKLADGDTYYIRIESWDEFGAGGITTDYAANMLGIPAGTEIPVAEVLQVDGRIIADASVDPYKVTLGPHNIDGSAALFAVENTGTGASNFAIYEDGSVEISGTVTITGGSGIASFSDAGALATADDVSYSSITGTKPPTNADNTASNTSADTAAVNGTAAATVASGANKANVGLDSSGQVALKIEGANMAPAGSVSAGLNLTADYMGFYSGGWKTYIKNDGTFYFDGNGSNYISWNGSTLTVRGNVQATSIASGAINGQTLVANQIYSSSSGRAIFIDGFNDTLKVLDSGGTARVTLDDFGSGYMDFTGDGSKTYGIAVTSCTTGFRAPSGCQYGANFVGTHYGVRGYGSYSGASGVEAQGTTYGITCIGGSHDAYLAGTGTTTSFTGAHESLFPKSSTQPELGDIVEVTSIAYKDSVSSTIPYVDLASTVESKKTYGVVSKIIDLADYDKSLDEDGNLNSRPIKVAALYGLTESEYNTLQSTHRNTIANGIGEGQINVCDDNGDIEIGDFICTSATAGKGQLYTGNDMRVVVAKALEPVDWSTEPETTKMIACIYMCS